MNWWKSILTLILLAAWLPATAHCGLESIDLVPVDKCCEKQPATHECESGCNVIEDGGIKSELARPCPVPPDALAIIPELASEAIVVFSDQPGWDGKTCQARNVSQFVIRTSLPIRAPTSAS